MSESDLRLAPVLLLAPRITDEVRFCLAQLKFVEARRPVFLLTPDKAATQAGITTIAPTEWGLAPLADALQPWPVVAQALALCCRHSGAEAAWYLAGQTLLFDPLTWVEQRLGQVEVASATDVAGLPTVVFARAEALAQVLASVPIPSNAETAADAHELIYEPLESISAGQVFDTGLQHTAGFRTEAGKATKEMVWVQGKPFFVEASSGLVARAITLHLPGPLAQRLHRYYTGPGMLLQKLKAEARLWLN